MHHGLIYSISVQIAYFSPNDSANTAGDSGRIDTMLRQTAKGFVHILARIEPDEHIPTPARELHAPPSSLNS